VTLKGEGSNVQADLLNNAYNVWSRTTKFGRITCTKKEYTLRVSHAPTARGRCFSAPKFWGSLLFMHTHVDAELPNLTWQHTRGRELSRPTPRGRGPSATQFWGFLSIHAYTLWRKTTKFDLITRIGKGLVFRESATPIPQGGAARALPNFRVPFYLWVHPLTQNYQIWRGYTYGVGACFRSQPRPQPKGAGSQCSPVLGFGSIYAHTLCRSMVTHVYLAVSHASHPKRAEFQRSTILRFSCIYAYTLYRMVTHMGRSVF